MNTKALFTLGIALCLCRDVQRLRRGFWQSRPPVDGKATLGKQLTDLKQARESGAITEEEYQTAKRRLVEGK